MFSGIQPTADSFHLGNYLGALRQWVALQDTHEAFYCVVDLHAITVPQDPAQLRQRTRVAAAQLFAAGLDPDRCMVFVQSHVPQHAELAWVLGCLTGFGEASRMMQFKDKAARGGARAGQRGAVHLPGAAGRGHPALPDRTRCRSARTSASTWSSAGTWRCGSTTATGPRSWCPRPYILSGVAKITDLQEPTAKMSKSSSSAAGIIDVLDEPGAIRKKIARAVTDPGSEVRADEAAKPGVTNLLRIYSALTGADVAGAGAAVRRRGLRHRSRRTWPRWWSTRSPRSGSGPRRCWPTRPSWTGCWPRAARARPSRRDHGHGQGPGGLPPPARA